MYGNVIIRASAGTGKTFQLSNRYISLLNSGAPPDQILATTFTRKASGEILDRVIVRLAAAASDKAQLRELAEHLPDDGLTQRRAYELLEQLIRNLHRLRICTLDSFFSQLAGAMSLELGLPPGWSIVAEIHDMRLRGAAIEAILRGDSTHEVWRLMHLITKGHAERSISELVQSTVAALYDVYAETSQNAWKQFPHVEPLKASQLEEALQQLESVALPDDKNWRNSRAESLAAAAQDDWEAFLSKGIAAKVLAGENQYRRREIPAAVRHAYQRLTQHAAAVLIEQVAQQTGATYQLLDKFAAQYQQLKQRYGVLRFEDVARSLAAAQSEDDLRRQQFRLDAQLSHVLLDEFQDTSLSQWQVLGPLVQTVTKRHGQQAFFWSGGQPSLFCVGDVKQAIYGWRGGRAEIFDALESYIPGLEHRLLNESHRSAQPIIDTVNRVFTDMTRHPNLEKLEPGVKQWCRQFHPHTTARTDLHGYAELITAPAAGEGQDQAERTLAFAAQRVDELVREAPGRTVGVLARRNAIVAQLIFQLRRLGVPASEEGGNPLTDSAAVQLILSLLRLADHPGDRVARFHLSYSPLAAGLGCPRPLDGPAAVGLARDVRHALLKDGYGRSVLRWSELLASSSDRRDRSRLQQLVELAFRFQPLANLRTSEFVRYVESERVADPTTASVRVMTIHQAKGLQFDIVVLADLDAELSGQPDPCVVGQSDLAAPVDRVCLYRNSLIQSLLPADLQELFNTALDKSVGEALCVLYVALTRAKHALHMILAPSKRNERSLHKTAAGLLRAALTDAGKLAAESRYYACGDPQWSQRQPAAARPSAPRPVELASRLRLAEPLGQRQTRLEFVSPSSLEGGKRVPAARLLQLERTAALARGTLLHTWMESIEWLEGPLPDERRLRRLAASMDTAGLNVDQLLKQFFTMLAAPAVAHCLSRDFYQPDQAGLAQILPERLPSSELQLEVANERRFLVREGQQILSGSIDRLVLIRHRSQLLAADIIDFKSDVVDAGDTQQLEAVVQFYQPQLQAYRRAVSTMYQLSQSRITARLLMLSAATMHVVSDQHQSTS